VTVKGWPQAIAKRLALDGHEHGGSLGWSVELSLQCGQTTTIRGELAIGRGDRATTLYSVDP
jgi:hypothetical protein